MKAIDHDLYLELIDATWEHRIIWEETKEPLVDIANTPFGQLSTSMKRWNVVIIRHSDHVTTRYAHLDRILVEVGDEVQRGNDIYLF